MEVKCGETLFTNQGVVIMVQFTDSGHMLTQIAFESWLRPVGNAAHKKLHDAVVAVLNETAKELESGKPITEDQE